MGVLISLGFLSDRANEDFAFKAGARLMLKDGLDVLAGTAMRGLVLDKTVEMRL